MVQLGGTSPALAVEAAMVALRDGNREVREAARALLCDIAALSTGAATQVVVNCCATVDAGATRDESIYDSELADILSVASANVLFDVCFMHNYHHPLPEFASWLVGIPLVVRQCEDGTCNVTLYDSAEEPISKEGV